MSYKGSISLSGSRAFRVLPRVQQAPLRWRVDNFINHYFDGWWRAEVAKAAARVTHNPVLIGTLRARVRNNETGRITDYGEISRKVVTTVGAEYIVDAFQGTVEPENMKFHGFGTGGAAEAVGNTGLTTELTTQYPTDNTRPTGTQGENGSTVYRTVGTLDPDADVAITEHGIFSANAAGVLLDRSLFSVINVTGAGTNTLEVTYDLTISAGG